MLKRKKPFRNIPKHVTKIARKLRQNLTECEKLLWERLSNKKLNGLRFRRQHPIGRYIADFYNHENRLVVEVDGKIHEKQKEYDLNRENFLKTNGYKVIRFKNDDIKSNMEIVLETILKNTKTGYNPYKSSSGGFRGLS